MFQRVKRAVFKIYKYKKLEIIVSTSETFIFILVRKLLPASMLIFEAFSINMRFDTFVDILGLKPKSKKGTLMIKLQLLPAKVLMVDIMFYNKYQGRRVGCCTAATEPP